MKKNPGCSDCECSVIVDRATPAEKACECGHIAGRHDLFCYVEGCRSVVPPGSITRDDTGVAFYCEEHERQHATKAAGQFADRIDEIMHDHDPDEITHTVESDEEWAANAVAVLRARGYGVTTSPRYADQGRTKVVAHEFTITRPSEPTHE